jgi:hypothetical protein
MRVHPKNHPNSLKDLAACLRIKHEAPNSQLGHDFAALFKRCPQARNDWEPTTDDKRQRE